jgi:hypothetical protein
LIDFNGDGDFDEIDVAILEEEENKKKESEKNNNSGCCVILFSAVSTISLVAWSFTHYLFYT